MTMAKPSGGFVGLCSRSEQKLVCGFAAINRLQLLIDRFE
jgi:hypothetical protein